jgi:hypothetical protein
MELATMERLWWLNNQRHHCELDTAHPGNQTLGTHLLRAALKLVSAGACASAGLTPRFPAKMRSCRNPLHVVASYSLCGERPLSVRSGIV